MPPLGRGQIVPKEDRTYYYRVAAPEDPEHRQHIPHCVQNVAIDPSRVLDMAKNCGPSDGDVNDFKSSMRQYNMRHGEQSRFQASIRSIVNNATTIQQGLGSYSRD